MMSKIDNKMGGAMNKRGFLLGEFTLKVIVAVLCIIVLAVLLFKLYGMFSNKTEVEKAGNTVDAVLERAQEAKLKGSADYVLLEPKNWILLYYPTGTPKACQGAKCLCLCKDGGIWDRIKDCKLSFNECTNSLGDILQKQLVSCDSDGACRKTDKNIEINGGIKIETATGIILSTKGDSITITKQNSVNV